MQKSRAINDFKKINNKYEYKINKKAKIVSKTIVLLLNHMLL